MSTNLDLVHSVFAHWERGDFSSMEWAAPNIDFVFADGPEPGSHVGRAAIQELFGRWLNSFADFRLLAERVIEVDEQRVLALTHVGGQGKTSGLNLALAGSAFAHLFELRGGEVARLEVFFDRDGALAGLGLEKQRVSEENVELVRRTFDAMHHGELQEAARGFHSDAVWQNTAQFPGPLRCVGPRAIMDFQTTMLEDFDGTQEIERVVEGGNTVVIGVHSVGRTTSGIPVDFGWAAVVRLGEGKIGRVDVHGEWSKALAAAGLPGYPYSGR